MAKSRYWNTDRLDQARTKSGGRTYYRLAVGERSNGKTTAPLLKMIRKRVAGEGNGVYLRQMEMDIKGQRGASIFRSLEYGGKNKDENLIELASGGKYTTTKYYNRAWYLGRTVETDDGVEETVYDREPFCYAMALSQVKHDKSATPANVTTVVFDEFQPIDGSYLVDETVLFRNTISTIVRDSARADIYLIANTTTWNSPYFKMFGMHKDVRDMLPGDLRVYGYPRTRKDGSVIEMGVAVEYCEDTASTHGGKDSDVYFVMADAHSAMITDGKFAVPDYPKCPHAFTAKNTKLTYWFETDEDEVIRGRLMKVGRDVFVFCERFEWSRYQTVRDDRRDIVYSLEFSSQRNHYTSPLIAYGDIRTRYLRDAFATNRMFFQSNEVGEDLMYFATQSRDRSILSL